MPLNSSRVNEIRLLSKKMLLLFAMFGLIFAMGSLVAKEADNSESAESDAEEEKVSSDETDEDEAVATDTSDTEEKSKSVATDQQATSDKKVVKKDVKESDSSVAKEKVKEKNPETGSYLPNGDKTSIVDRVTGDGIRDLYWQVEYLRR